MCLVSVIVPIYNVEKYLKKCLNSIQNQSFRDMEIICIDDGSTDDSGKIADSFMKKDGRFKVFHNPNKGYGYSLNYGITCAKGKYVGIVESDDFILPNMFEELYRVAENHAVDFVKSDFYATYEGPLGDTRYIYTHIQTEGEWYNRVFCPRKEIDSFKLIRNNWTGLYSRKFLLDNNILHQETPGASYQDIGFWFQCFFFAERVYIIKNAYYVYRIDNPNASMHCSNKIYEVSGEYDFLHKRLKDDVKWCDEIKYILHFFESMDNLESLKRLDDYGKERLMQYFRPKLLEWIHNGEMPVAYCNNYLQSEFFSLSVSVEQFLSQYKKQHKDWLQPFIIFGDGQKGHQLWNIICHYNKSEKIICFAVSKTKPDVNDVIAIRSIDELVSYKDRVPVVICVRKENEEKVETKLRKKGFKYVMRYTEFIELIEKQRQ